MKKKREICERFTASMEEANDIFVCIWKRVLIPASFQGVGPSIIASPATPLCLV